MPAYASYHILKGSFSFYVKTVKHKCNNISRRTHTQTEIPLVHRIKCQQSNILTVCHGALSSSLNLHDFIITHAPLTVGIYAGVTQKERFEVELFMGFTGVLKKHSIK